MATSAAITVLAPRYLRAVFEDIERIRERSPELFASAPAKVSTRRNVVVWE